MIRKFGSSSRSLKDARIKKEGMDNIDARVTNIHDKYYRLNFIYNGKHYSIQEFGELHEEYLTLRCKEDGWVADCWPKRNPYKYIIDFYPKHYKRGATYSRMKLDIPSIEKDFKITLD